MFEFYRGQFLKAEDLEVLNQVLFKKNQHFRFGLFNRANFRIGKKNIGIVASGNGEIKGAQNARFETNDILLLDQGEYSIDSPGFKILTIEGPNLFEQGQIISQADSPVLQSTVGGTRKLLKRDEGRFNIDIHLIWVDEKNIKIPHYHTRVFELYLPEAGEGEILLKDPADKEYRESPKLAPGWFVLVPPNVVHKAQGKDLEILVVGIPSFYEEDSFIIKD